MSVPKFLDLDLDEREGRLLQAWMYPDHPVASSEDETPPTIVWHPDISVQAYQPTGLMSSYCAISQTEFTVQDFGIDISPGGYAFLVPYGEAIAIPARVCVNEQAEVTSAAHVAAEPESASVEDERVITFRAVPPRVQEAIRSGSVRPLFNATEFAARARGRRLHFEEDPEQQSE